MLLFPISYSYILQMQNPSHSYLPREGIPLSVTFMDTLLIHPSRSFRDAIHLLMFTQASGHAQGCGYLIDGAVAGGGG